MIKLTQSTDNGHVYGMVVAAWIATVASIYLILTRHLIESDIAVAMGMGLWARAVVLLRPFWHRQ